MSSAPNSAPEVIPPATPRPRRRGSAWTVLILIGIVGAGSVLAYRSLAAREEADVAAAAVIRTAPVTSGTLEKTVRVAGVTSSIVYTNVPAPRMMGGERRPLVLLELLPSGTRVKKGDVVARIDGQSMRDHIDDVQATVDASLADIKKRRAEQTVDWNNLQQSLTVAQSNWDKWKLEAQAAEVRTIVDREILKIGVEESRAAYEQQQNDLEFQKRAHAAELKILDITSERHVQHRMRHQHDLDRYTVSAPMNGMVVRQQIIRNGELGVVEVGDPLWPGLLFAKIMDTDRMQIEAKISQTDSNLFKIGMEARIGLDAFPELELTGKIYSIGALAKSATESPYVREIPILIRIAGSNPKLIPDLSGFADVVIDRIEDATRVPIGAITTEEGQSYVYVRAGQQFEKRPVEIGLRNATHAEVKSGLQLGEQVALDSPTS